MVYLTGLERAVNTLGFSFRLPLVGDYVLLFLLLLLLFLLDGCLGSVIYMWILLVLISSWYSCWCCNSITVGVGVGVDATLAATVPTLFLLFFFYWSWCYYWCWCWSCKYSSFSTSFFHFFLLQFFPSNMYWYFCFIVCV